MPTDPPFFEVVLFEPEIPNNTGNIGRTCLALGASLHLIEPLGFDLSEKALRRAGLDYWPRLAPTIHRSWDDYLAHTPDATRWYFSTRAPDQAARAPWDAALNRGDHLVFGPETRGLPAPLLDTHHSSILTYPMIEGERSLNLATVVCAALTEGTRQLSIKNQIHLSALGKIHT